MSNLKLNMYNIKISCNLFLKLCALVHFMKRKCKNARYIRKGHLVFLSLESSSGTIAFRDFTVSRENRLLKCYFRSFGGTKISKFSRTVKLLYYRYACQLATLVLYFQRKRFQSKIISVSFKYENSKVMI